MLLVQQSLQFVTGMTRVRRRRIDYKDQCLRVVVKPMGMRKTAFLGTTHVLDKTGNFLTVNLINSIIYRWSSLQDSAELPLFAGVIVPIEDNFCLLLLQAK